MKITQFTLGRWDQSATFLLLCMFPTSDWLHPLCGPCK